MFPKLTSKNLTSYQIYKKAFIQKASFLKLFIKISYILYVDRNQLKLTNLYTEKLIQYEFNLCKNYGHFTYGFIIKFMFFRNIQINLFVLLNPINAFHIVV